MRISAGFRFIRFTVMKLMLSPLFRKADCRLSNKIFMRLSTPFPCLLFFSDLQKSFLKGAQRTLVLGEKFHITTKWETHRYIILWIIQMGKCIPLSAKFFHRVLRMLCTFDFLHNLWKFWVKFCCGCRRESPWIARAFAVRFAANTFVETEMNLQQNKFCFLENNTFFFAFEKSTNSFSHESSQHGKPHGKKWAF